jgi:hypothetical protein
VVLPGEEGVMRDIDLLTLIAWTIGVAWLFFIVGMVVAYRDWRRKRQMLEFDLEEMTSQRDALSAYAEGLEDKLAGKDVAA